MSTMDFKLYGLCIERLKHQIKLAEKRLEDSPHKYNGRVVLEGYETGDMEEIIDLLELYDIERKDLACLRERLSELAENASLLVRKRIEFDFDDEGMLCLYLRIDTENQ
jgi:hypothetical protein